MCSPYMLPAVCIACSSWAQAIANLPVISEESIHFTPHLLEILFQVHYFRNLCTTILVTIVHSFFSFKLLDSRFDLN